ncbi:Colicin I receptor precursor [Sporomusa ovata DSM 2662]|uniref:Outer membrane vitamin B12 receptor BtuB n=1 Tax=Sporomusa ovata TaxID=2378 RepID=A0A0U1L5B5_9FIRM|nr:TonB-dependent receptor [Sporomusa ovata]EQB26120.1 TonB-dependent receptor [Sporomusa ovata DSM 2662]CQR74695.1 Outer membrane vitamin B12 receptor BtuB [Sporomusa ovata]
MKKSKLSVIVSVMLLYSSFASVAGAEEAANTSSDVEEVEVTADRIKQINPVNITVVNADEIKAQGARNVAEALKDVSGLYITNNDAQGKSIAMFRGSDAENTRVFVDGIPLSPVGDGKVDLRAIPSENIEKIEVIKGAVPVIYGTNAPGGIIYITTKKAGDKAGQTVSITTGSHREKSIFASASGKNGKLSYLVDVKKENTDGYTAHAQGKDNYFDGKFNFDISPKASVTIVGSYTEKNYQIPNRIDPATGQIYSKGSLATVSSGDYLAYTYNWEYEPWKNKYIGMLYNQKLSDNNELSLRLYRTNENSHLKGFGWLQGNVADINNDWAHVYTDGTVKGLELQDTIRTSRANTVIWGYTHESRDYQQKQDSIMVWVDPNDKDQKKQYYLGMDHSNYEYTGKSFYLQDSANINQRLAVTFGFRHDDISDHAGLHLDSTRAIPDQRGKGTANKPQVSFNYSLADKTLLHGAFGKSYRWPNVTERLHPGGSYGETDIVNFFTKDPNTGETTDGHVPWYQWRDGTWHKYTSDCTYVLPEEAINREIGLTHSFHSGLKFDVTYFSKNITNMIKGQSYSYAPTSDPYYYNIPSVQMHGYEVQVSHQIAKRIKGFLSYSYTNAWDPIMMQQVCDVAPRKFSYGFNYTGQDGINAYLSMNYVGSYQSQFSTGNGNGNGDSNLAKTLTIPGHHTVDLRVSKRVNNEEYYVRVTNLLNEKYYSGFYLVAPGRYVEFGTNISF